MKTFKNPNKVVDFLNAMDGLTKKEVDQKQAERFTRIFGNSFSRLMPLENDLDDYYSIIKEAKKMDGYLARALSQIIQKALKNGWSFRSKNQKNIKVVEKRFNELLADSGLNTRSFLREIVKNCVSYSNAFVLKSYLTKGSQKKLAFLTIMPVAGWEPLETRGPFVTKWQFTSNTGKTTVFDGKDIIHFHMNKEIDEVFGTPFISSVLEDAQLLRDLEGAVLEQYFASSQKRTVFFVGTPNSPGSEKEIDNLRNTLNSLDTNSDLIVTSRIKFEILEVEYKEPTKLLETFKERIFAGLLMSSSGMGISGAGRQDADTQETKESIIVEDFQDAIEDILNNTLLKEISFEQFKSLDYEVIVEFCFNENFNDKERSDNHYLNLYNSGVIDFNELREFLKLPSSSFDESKSIENKKLTIAEEEAKIALKYTPKVTTSSVTNKKAANTTKSKTNPTNQYGTKKTSKPSVKN